VPIRGNRAAASSAFVIQCVYRGRLECRYLVGAYAVVSVPL
jgi:hypothetical protein